MQEWRTEPEIQVQVPALPSQAECHQVRSFWLPLCFLSSKEERRELCGAELWVRRHTVPSRVLYGTGTGWTSDDWEWGAWKGRSLIIWGKLMGHWNISGNIKSLQYKRHGGRRWVNRRRFYPRKALMEKIPVTPHSGRYSGAIYAKGSPWNVSGRFQIRGAI